jgi:HEAT repeat protein
MAAQRKARRAGSGVILCAILIVAPPSWAAAERRIGDLAQRARLVVSGSVRSVTPYGDGRIAVAEFASQEVLKGRTPTGPIAIVEMRDVPNRSVLTVGAHGVAFLRRTSRSSYLRDHLPAGEYYELLTARSAFVAGDSTATGKEIATLTRRILAPARGIQEDATLGLQKSRQLTFDLLASGHPMLVEEGIAALPAIRSPLAATEVATLDATLVRETLGARVRIDLIRAIAIAELDEAIPGLTEVQSPPEVMEAAWRALGQLGAPPEEESIRERLVSEQPQVRIAAMREILRRQGLAAVSDVGPIAVADPEVAVREAALEALADLGSPEALPPLERVFAQESGALRQAAGRSILAVGGPAAAESLARLAFEAPISGQRYAVVLLMTMDSEETRQSLERVRTVHPNDEVRHLVEHGLPISRH